MDAFVSFVVEQLGSLIKDEVGLLIGVKKEVEKLQSKFTAIRARLGKAEKRQITDETVRDWLRKIKEVVYEVEDILDEWRTDAFLSQRDKEDIGNQRTVGFPSFFHRSFFKRLKRSYETGQRIRELAERLDGISKEKIDFSWNEDHNIEEVELMSKMKAQETGSLIDESKIVGRDGVKKNIINELISDNNRKQKSVSVTSIVGMGGLGKTTLAQLVYNDERVKTHFKKQIWVCVSDPFDVNKIATEVIESLGGSNPKNPNLNTLQHKLRKVVRQMPFLLVLDDVWNEDRTLWEKLRVPLIGAAQGSKILITTRSRKAAEVMETTYYHNLEQLSHSDCLNLFKSIAFKGVKAEEFPELTEVGEDIVRRCKGLPLAVRAVGSLLGCRRTYEYWKHIFDSRIWEWDDEDILPALLLSYYSLPFHLKRCFSFCSLFPKDSVMKKVELVQLWMANGLIESKKADIEGDHLEEIGEMYFDDLLARSLFQDADKNYNGNIYQCKMHDLVHDLATRVTDDDDSPPTNCHHLSFGLNHVVSSIPSRLYNTPRLRTLILVLSSTGGLLCTSEIPDSLFNHLRFLRALELTGPCIENLPSSISKLKHLRYLNLSQTRIKELPESVTNLCNLQTLKLYRCSCLCMLPSGMSKMVQLRHLEIEGTYNLAFLPNGLGNLTTLRTLSRFPVSDENRGCEIGELRNPDLLRGTLWIENLESVLDVNEAREAQLNEKSYLQTLALDFIGRTDEELRMLGDGEMERMESLFEGLLTTLRTLLKFPVSNENRGCKIGELKNLNLLKGELRIENLESVLDVNEAREAQLNEKSYLQTLALDYKRRTDEGWRMLGDGEMERMESLFEGLGPLHPNLRRLEIHNYVGSKFSSWLEDSAFSRLTEVLLWDCKKLRLLPSLGNLCSLKSLSIARAYEVKVVGVEFCGNGAGRGIGFPKLENLRFYEMANWEEWKLTDECGDQVMPSLKELVIADCNKLKALPDRLPRNLRKVRVECEEVTWMPCHALPLLEDLSLRGHVKVKILPFPALETLHIEEASNETLLSDGWELLESLHTIAIGHCPRLEFLPDWVGKLKALQALGIAGCSQLTNLPEGLGQLETLHALSIKRCSGFTSLFNGSGQFKALRRLDIRYCESLRSISDGLVHFEALQSLHVKGCPKLQSLFDGFEQLKSSLRSLTIIECPQLKHFPPLQYLTTLETLVINKCPLVKQQLEKEIEEDRCSVSHIRNIEIGWKRIKKVF